MTALDARSLRALALTAVAAVALAACGGGSSSTAVATAPAPPASLESKYGSGFASAFDAQANTEPTAVSSSTVFSGPILTTEPLPLS